MLGEQSSTEVETIVAQTSDTMQVTSEFVEIATGLFRVGKGRYSAVEFVLHKPEYVFKIPCHEIQDTIIGREDKQFHFRPTIDLSKFGGKLFGVSRRHATLNNRNGMLYITDHNTTNGTYVNNRRIEPEVPYVLTHGDTVNISRVRLTIRFTDRVLSD